MSSESLSRARARRAAGFTALEALIVLVIIALAAGLGTVGFHRWVVRARTNEALSMLAEISSQEQAFKAGGGHYLALRADERPDTAPPDEEPVAFYPLPADSPSLASARTATRADDPARWPAAWRVLGLRPAARSLYCTYLVNAGEEGTVPPGLPFGTALLGDAQPGPWFYALAACNLSGGGGYPDGVTVFGISSRSGEVRTFNQGK